MIGLVEEFTLITHSVFLLILVYHGNLFDLFDVFEFLVTFAKAVAFLFQATRSVQRESSGTCNWETRIAFVSY